MRFLLTLILLAIGLFIHSQDNVFAESDSGDPWAIIDNAIGPAAAHGSYLFVAQGRYLHVFDQRDKDHPKVLDCQTSFCNPIVSMKLKYPALYCLEHDDGAPYWSFSGVDLSKPVQPRRIKMNGLKLLKRGNVDVKIVFRGNRLYVTEYNQAYDIHNPLHPISLDATEEELEWLENGKHPEDTSETLSVPKDMLFAGSFSRIRAEGQLFHIDDGKGRDNLFDLSNPNCPKFLGATRSTSLTQPGAALIPFSLNPIAFAGKYRARFVETEEVHNAEDAVAIEEIAPAAKPRRLALIESTDQEYWRHITGMCLIGQRLYLAVYFSNTAGHNASIVPFDLSDPTKPRQLNSFGASYTDPRAMAMDDRYLYIVRGDSLNIHQRQ